MQDLFWSAVLAALVGASLGYAWLCDDAQGGGRSGVSHILAATSPAAANSMISP